MKFKNKVDVDRAVSFIADKVKRNLDKDTDILDKLQYILNEFNIDLRYKEDTDFILGTATTEGGRPLITVNRNKKDLEVYIISHLIGGILLHWKWHTKQNLNDVGIMICDSTIFSTFSKYTDSTERHYFANELLYYI